MAKRVAVLMGGISAEREVSLSSGAGCLKALRAGGFDAYPIDVTDDIAALVKALTPPPDCVFNMLHGRFGEDGCIQGLLELMGVPYTGSGVLSSALGMDKRVSRAVLEAAGLAMPPAMLIHRAGAPKGDPMPRPFVVKPVAEGSSVGVRVLFEGDNEPAFDAETWAFGDEVYVERYIPGREIQAAVIGEGEGASALGAIEIRTRRKFYDYVAKYTPGESEHLMPAPIHPDGYAEVLRVAERAHRALSCRGVSRVDLRYDDTGGEPGKVYVLEVNTQPGMTPTSLVPEIAAYHRVSYVALVKWMVELATCDVPASIRRPVRHKGDAA
ncbi:MAG: D-alanine--D-alanine ligase [Alphaproteobacteria bacterium]